MAANSVKMRLLRRGAEPPGPGSPPCRFGLQDTKGALHAGAIREDGLLAFDFELTVKPGPDPERPVFGGPFASGPRDERFVYLSWQRIDGQGYAGRIKARLADLDWSLVRQAQAMDASLEADLTGRAYAGGRLPVTWRIAPDEARGLPA
jgi:hypothetical protein